MSDATPGQIKWTVIAADGSTGGTPSARDIALYGRVDALMRRDPHFQALNRPTLARLEVNGALPDTEDGHLYLRYDLKSGVPQEFWAHFGPHDRVRWRGGKITVENAIGTAH